MKEKRKEKNVSSSHHKSKKKHKKKYETSDDSDSEGDKMQWVEAPPIQNKIKMKKEKKKQKKHARSSSNDSESDGAEMQKIDRSSTSKTKKKKKHKKSKHFSSNDSESSSDKDSGKDSLQKPVTDERDSWMNEETFVHTLSKDEMYLTSRQRRLDSMKEHREREEKIQRERELNPHWKNEGTGLPEKAVNVDSLSLPSTSVGDGGYSWLKKAYYRIQEQAQQEGRSMDEVAVERWGSLNKLISLIEEAEERMKSHPDWKNSNDLYKDKYEQHNRSSKMKFQKPSNEYEKSFDSPYQFRKPTDDFKSQKVLNRFKSSEKTSNTSYTIEKNEPSSSHKKNLEVSSDNKSHVPSWKKSQYSEINKSTSENRSHVPSWKKPQYSENSEMKKSSLENRSHVPAWKKYSEDKAVSNGSENSKHSVKEVSKEMEDVPTMFSENDLNKLAAKQIKAEMMGDTSLAEKLKKQLDEAREIIKEKGFAKQQSSKKVEEIVLSKFDSQGQARPIRTTQENILDYKQKKKNKFFDDGSSHSLKQMFEREKLTTADDQLEMFVEASAQSNEAAEIDYESGHISKKLSKKLSSTREEERDIGKAIQQHQKHSASLEKCHFCMDQPHMKKYLIVDVGENVYLCLPVFQAMAEGHCLLVPKDHVSSFLSLDDNEWREVNDFKNQLRNMFRSENKSVIFLETSMHFRHFPHAVLECIPVPEEEGDMAPFYFKKAIQESETEWANNKKLIDLTNKGLRQSVPKGLPYFYVEFDPKVHAGYAHVIEEEKYFPRNFGKEVVGGMLDIDYNHLYKNRKEDPLKKAQEVVNFQKKWKLFKM